MSSDAAVRSATATQLAEPRIAARIPAAWWIIVGVAVLAYLLPLRALLHAPGAAMEEGFMLVFPDRVLHGAVANKDFLYLYGPGSLWALAALYKVFGTHLLVERLAGLAQLVGMAVAAGLLVRWWGRSVAVTAVVLNVMFVMPSLQLVAIPWTGGAALALGSLVALLQARHDGGDRGALWALIGGVLAGLAMLFRIDLGLALALGGAAALWALPRPIVTRAVIGTAIGLSPYLAHLALAGPATVWRGMLIDPMIHLRAARHLPVPPNPDHLVGVARVIAAFDPSWPLPRLTPPQQLFAWFLLLVVLAVALLAFGIWRVRRAPSAFRPRVLLAGALFGLGIFPQAVQRADSAHLAWVSGTLVVLLPAALAEAITLVRPAWRSSRIGFAAGVGVIIGVSLLLPTYTARRYIGAVQDSFHLPKTIEISNDGRSWYVGSDAGFADSIERLLQAVERDVKPGSRIIVGNSDMRRVPYNDTFLYYLLPRFVPGTASMEFEPGLTNRRGTTLTGEMRRADAFIASDRWLGWDEPNDAMKPGDPGPADVLHSKFCPTEDFGNGFKLFLPCPPDHPPEG
ncbi:MAG: hypothetical protein QOH28_3595 [Actinomycetota bacterium]|nr:hypothetical protein [Actinomycetota bacterium]